MKRHILFSAAMAALMLLSGCAAPAFLSSLFDRSDPEQPGASLTVYRLAADGQGELLQTETLPLAADAQELDAAMAAFTSAPQDAALACALPDGVAAEEWALADGVVTLRLSDSYLALSEMSKTVTAFCATLTLCGLESVDAVTIAAGETVVFAGLTPEDALLTAADTDPYVRQLRLYFPDGDGRYLVSEYHSLTLDEDTSPERYVIEELLRGPNSAELQSAIPTNTRLLSCSTAEGVCTVDLSAEFLQNRPATALGERLAVYSLVNSLAALPGVDSVLLLVEGQLVDTYVYRSLSQPLSRYDEAVGPVSAPKGEFDADLYLALPGLNAITALPFRVSQSDYATRAEALLAALLAAAEPGYPALFSAGGNQLDITATGALCIVDLPESFFASLPENARSTAVQSIAATLCALPDISAVRFTVDGGEAIFDGVSFSGPWLNFDDIEVD